MAIDDEASPKGAGEGSARKGPQRALPLFYSKVRPIDPRLHAGKSLPAVISYQFAAKANSVPINGGEFVALQRTYPIVFARSGDNLVALAVLALRPDENLFVDANGRWERHAYVPAYVRRFPFVFVEASDGRMALAIEHDFLVEDGGRPLFDAEQKPTALLQGAMAFCGSFQKGHIESRAFFEGLVKENLLVEQQADAVAGAGQRVRLSGFHIIDEDRLKALSPATLVDWRAKGWLAWAYAQIFSHQNWRLLGQRGSPPAPA
jgi:hypothetical protein